MMDGKTNQCPDDFIAYDKKDYDWHLDYVNYLTGIFDTDGFQQERYKDDQNFKILMGKFNPKEYEYVTNLFGLNSPARLVNYPLIMPQFQLLMGEFISQPLQYSSFVTNRDAVVSKLDEKMNIAAETLLSPIRKQIENEAGFELEQEDMGMEIPDDIKTFLETPFRVAIEDKIDKGLYHLIHKYDLKREYTRALLDILTTSKAFFHVRRRGQDPVPTRIDVRNMIYSTNTSHDNLKKCNYVGYNQMLTLNELSDLFVTEDLSKKDWEYIESLKGKDEEWFRTNDFGGEYYDRSNKQTKIKVTYLEWKSMRAIKCLVSENKYDPDMPFYKFVKDDYKPKKKDKIITKYIQWVHSAYKVGHEKLISWGGRAHQIRYEDNYADSYFTIAGVIHNNIDGNTLSVVDSTKNIQILYNIVSYHIEVALSRSGGKAFVYDTSQMPDGFTVKDVMHYGKNYGVITINSAQEGNMGRSFNQFQTVDFGLPNSFQQLINLRMVLGETMSKMTGISDARAGINKASDLVGVNERNVMQSSLITAPYFDSLYYLISQTFELMSNMFSKYWNGNDMKLKVLGDSLYEIVKIDDAVSMAEYGISVKNTGNDKQKKDQLMMHLDRFAQSGQIDPLSIVKSVFSESAVDVEDIIKKGVESLQERQQQAQQAQQQNEAQKTQVEAQKLQQDMQIAQMDDATKRYIADSNNETKLRIKDKDDDFQAEKFDEEVMTDIDKQMLDHQNKMSEYAMQNSVNQTSRELNNQENQSF